MVKCVCIYGTCPNLLYSINVAWKQCISLSTTKELCHNITCSVTIHWSSLRMVFTPPYTQSLSVSHIRACTRIHTLTWSWCMLHRLFIWENLPILDYKVSIITRNTPHLSIFNLSFVGIFETTNLYSVSILVFK